MNQTIEDVGFSMFIVLSEKGTMTKTGSKKRAMNLAKKLQDKEDCNVVVYMATSGCFVNSKEELVYG